MPNKPLTDKELTKRKAALAKQMAANGQAIPKAATGMFTGLASSIPSAQEIYDNPAVQAGIADGSVNTDYFKNQGVDISGAVASASNSGNAAATVNTDAAGNVIKSGQMGAGKDPSTYTDAETAAATEGLFKQDGTPDTVAHATMLSTDAKFGETKVNASNRVVVDSSGKAVTDLSELGVDTGTLTPAQTDALISASDAAAARGKKLTAEEKLKVINDITAAEQKAKDDEEARKLGADPSKTTTALSSDYKTIITTYINFNGDQIGEPVSSLNPKYNTVTNSELTQTLENGDKLYTDYNEYGISINVGRVVKATDDDTEGDDAEGDDAEGDDAEGDGTDDQEPIPEGYTLKYQLPQDDGSFIYVYANEDGELLTRQGPAQTGINSLVFNPNDPRGYNAQMAIDPAIAERGIYRYQDQDYDPAIEGMRGTTGGLPIYDGEGRIVGYTPGDKTSFLKTQTGTAIPTAERAGTPIYNDAGQITGYSSPQAVGPDQQRPIYNAQGEITGYTAGMQANTTTAQRVGAPILDAQGSITGYTNQVQTKAQQRLQPIFDADGTITGYTQASGLTREATAPQQVDAQGNPIAPVPSSGALISEAEATKIAGDIATPKAEINAIDLPDRAGMVANELTIVRDDDGTIIGAIPAGAEIPTAATIQELGKEAFNVLKDEEGESIVPTASYTATATALGTGGRKQVDVTAQEKVAAAIGNDPLKIKGKGIIEKASGKTTISLSETELAAAAAVGQTEEVVATLFPSAIDGNVSALDTVKGQLASMMTEFDDGTPDWAAGSIRVANQIMAERGLGNSSIAAATIVQAAQEAALPIAQADAQIYANMNLTNLSNKNKYALDNAAAARGFKLQNLSNKQQAELANSAQRYTLLGESLSNTQTAMLANAQMSNALQEQDLSRSQQEQIANAARYAEQENLNLTHDQQRRITDATNQMQVDLANLSTKEKTVLSQLQVQAALEGQELSNIQQTNTIKATRYAEANNLDFTAEQSRVFSNSKMVETIALDNLEFEQTRTLQNAANYATMDVSNLNNRQASQVTNAQNFLQMDLANLNNAQQSAMLDAQGLQQFMLTDAAAENASRQFNATSQNQVDQFYEQITGDISKYNANLNAAMNQFNAGQDNAMSQYNATMANQREQFNSNAALQIEQANVNYRRELNTLNTAGANLEAQQLAENYFNISQQSMANVWQDYRDTMNYAYNQAQNDKDRTFNLGMALMQRDQENQMFADKVDYSTGIALGNMAIGLLATISDVRLKTNIKKEKTYNNGLGWYTWNWNDTAKELGYGKRSTSGFLAQEVLEVYPDTIVEKKNGYMALMFNDVLRRSENV